MRKRLSALALFVLVVSSETPTASERMSAERMANFVTGITRHYCGDLEFRKCSNINYEHCTQRISAALYQCDYRPVWEEFKRLDAQGKKILPNKENDRFAACVGIKLKDMDHCTIERDARHVKWLKENDKSE
jgi:hypothetical protein